MSGGTIMAKFLSHVLTDVSGSVGDTTYARNRNGNYIRKRIAPTQPRTQAQQQVRAAFSATAQAWRGLTEAQRTAWHGLGVQMTITDSLGQSSTLTGSQAHASVNGIRAAAGDNPLSDAPGQPDAVAPLPTITLEAVHTGGAGGPFVLRVHSDAYSGRVLIAATPAVSAGRDFFGKSAFRLIQTTETLTAGATVITAAYVARYGTPAPGTKIAVRLVPVSANGFKGASYFATAIVGVSA